MAMSLVIDMFQFPQEWGVMWLPALLFTFQANLLYSGYQKLAAGIVQIIYQSRIVFIALFSVWLLKRRLILYHWLAVMMLVLGVMCAVWTDTFGAPGRSPMGGALAVLLAGLCTAFGSIHFEKMLKDKRKSSLWLRSIQLVFCRGVLSTIWVVLEADVRVIDEGLFYGFDQTVWGGIVWQVVAQRASWAHWRFWA
jgi:solute carrier family 35 (UDP-sugar transporter), member A1/2/3